MLSALSQAWASWKTAPGVALLAVVAFAVGIGSTTAIFTVINGVLMRPLPYPDSERFVSLSGSKQEVVEDIERRSQVQLAVMGIGHNVSPFYSNATTIAGIEQLGPALSHKLISLLGST